MKLYTVGWCGVSRDPSQPFRSRANSHPGAKVPIGPWPIRSLELSLQGPFVPGPFRSLELSLHGANWLWNFRSLELSFSIVECDYDDDDD